MLLNMTASFFMGESVNINLFYIYFLNLHLNILLVQRTIVLRIIVTGMIDLELKKVL